MTAYLIIKYLHILCILLMFSFVVAELLLVKNKLSKKEIQFLAKLDTFYGIASILVVAFGLTLWFGVGKPADFYTRNTVFLVKVGLAILVGILSLVPTVFFLKNRKGDISEIVSVPKSIRAFIILELLILCFIPLLAVLMASGIGYSH